MAENFIAFVQKTAIINPFWGPPRLDPIRGSSCGQHLLDPGHHTGDREHFTVVFARGPLKFKGIAGTFTAKLHAVYTFAYACLPTSEAFNVIASGAWQSSADPHDYVKGDRPITLFSVNRGRRIRRPTAHWTERHHRWHIRPPAIQRKVCERNLKVRPPSFVPGELRTGKYTLTVLGLFQ